MLTPSKLFGIEIYVSPDRPRYVLPEEILPGVPWDPAFRKEINDWAQANLGYWNPLPDGETLMSTPNQVIVNPRTYVALRASAEKEFL